MFFKVQAMQQNIKKKNYFKKIYLSNYYKFYNFLIDKIFFEINFLIKTNLNL